MQIVALFAFHPLRFIVNEQFHLIEIGICPYVNGLAGSPVPVREDVQHLFIGQFALVHVKHIFGEPGQIDNSEIGATRWPSVGSGFPQIIHAGPDVHPWQVIVFFHDFPGLFVGRTPGSGTVVVRGAGIANISFVEWQIPTFGPAADAVAGHIVLPSGIQRWSGFGGNEFFSRKFGGELFKGFVMVVKANQIQSLRFDDEIVGFRIVAGWSNWAGNI